MDLKQLEERLLVYLEDEPNGRADTYRMCALTGLSYSAAYSYLRILAAGDKVKMVKTKKHTIWILPSKQVEVEPVQKELPKPAERPVQDLSVPSGMVD